MSYLVLIKKLERFLTIILILSGFTYVILVFTQRVYLDMQKKSIL